MHVESRNPASREVVYSGRAASRRDIEAALAVAASAWPRWVVRSVAERAEVLRAFADLVDDEVDRLADLIQREVGKRSGDARGEVKWTALSARWYADHPPLAEEVDGAMIERVPLGVIVAITPWNVPLITPAWKWLPALIAGNAVVWKPSELSTGIAIEAVRLMERAGLPAGLLTVLPGGAAVARALCSDPRVAGVHFTGSTRAGRAINQLVAPRFARAALEMGGVNAAVVFPDADLSEAAAAVVGSGTALAGQKCTAIRRVLVHTEAADRFLDEVRDRVKGLVVGPPDRPGVDVGPMVSSAARRTADDTVAAAVKRGGKVMAATTLPPDLAGERSAYFAPVVLGGLPADDPLKMDEVFAPILVLDMFDDNDDVWSMANASGYGLVGAVYSADPARAAEARRLAVGVLAINGRSDSVGLEQPFGGRGLSGNGFPEGGHYVYSAVTHTVAVYDHGAPAKEATDAG